MAIIKIFRTGQVTQVQPQVVRIVRVYDHPVPAGIQESIFTEKGSLIVGTGPESYTEFPPGTVGQYLTPDPSSPTGLKYETPSVAVQDTTNYALNGGFDFAEGQMDPATLTTIADGGYGPDQWKSYRENADLQYRRVDGSGDASLTSPHYGEYKKITNAGKILLCQPLEFLNTLRFRGNAVGFQLKMKANAAKTIKIAIAELQTGGTADTIPAVVSSWNADSTDPTLGANIALIGSATSCAVTTAWQTFQVTGTFPSNSKNLLLLVWSDADMAANDTLHLAEAGLYFGATLRSWRPRLIGDELRLLQRYYYMHVKGDQKIVGNGALKSASVLVCAISLPVRMRTIPSLDAASGTNYYYHNRSSIDLFNSFVYTNFETETMVELANTTEISGTAGDGGTIRTNNASAYVGFNARL